MVFVTRIFPSRGGEGSARNECIWLVAGEIKTEIRYKAVYRRRGKLVCSSGWCREKPQETREPDSHDCDVSRRRWMWRVATRRLLLYTAPLLSRKEREVGGREEEERKKNEERRSGEKSPFLPRISLDASFLSFFSLFFFSINPAVKFALNSRFQWKCFLPAVSLSLS